MSVRAAIYRMVLRLTMKRPKLPKGVQTARRHMNRLANRLPAPPASISVRQCDLDGMGGVEFVHARGTREQVLLYFHGGGYVVCSPKTHQNLLWRLARATGMRVIAVDYRLAPEHPFPAALEDAVTAYRWLLARDVAASRIAFGGDSAGGGLVLAALAASRELGLPLPTAAVCFSPWTDLALTGESIRINAERDPMLSGPLLELGASLYLAGASAEDSRASPLYADPKGFPPILIQVGSTEMLLDDARRMAERLQRAGVDTRLEVWPKMPHVWQITAGWVPEADAALKKAAAFLKNRFESNASLPLEKPPNFF